MRLVLTLVQVLSLVLLGWAGGIGCDRTTTAWQQGSSTVWVWAGITWALAVALLLALHHLARTHQATR